MKLGLSSYSLVKAMKSGEMTILDAIEWTAENGGEHIELTPKSFGMQGNDLQLIESICAKARQTGIEISNYAIAANFLQPDDEQYEAEIARVMMQVDIAHAFGVKRMRHDVAKRPIPEATLIRFQHDVDRLADACRRIANYAAKYEITTSIENHGFYIQGSDRVLALVDAVGSDNFRVTMDIGNVMCVDEDSVVATRKMLPMVSMVHLKDFYLRPAHRDPGEGWFKTAGGNYLRGAIVGQGDVDMWSVIKTVKDSGYTGYISIEFEGLEDCRFGSRAGLANARRIWDEI
jgi:sugar phosphate isomerase/epimerase